MEGCLYMAIVDEDTPSSMVGDPVEALSKAPKLTLDVKEFSLRVEKK